MTVESDPARIPFEIRQLDHVVVRTTNVAALLEFYGALGCRVVRSSDELGLHQLRAGASMLDIVDANGPLGKKAGGAPVAEGRNMDHFALRIEPFDAEALAAYFAALGTEFTAPQFRLFGAEGFGPAAYVSDPDGNTVELKGPPDPEQPTD